MRLLAACASVVVLLLIALGLIFPSATGIMGMDIVTAPDRVGIEAVSAGSPAAAAGMMAGDVVRLDRMAFDERIAYRYATAGVPVTLSVDRPGSQPVVTVVPVRAEGVPRPWFVIPLALIYLSLALLVAWRAQPTRAAWALVAFCVALAATAGVDFANASLPTPQLRFAFDLLGSLCVDAVLFAQLVFALIFPPRASRVHRILTALGLVAASVALVSFGFWPAANMLLWSGWLSLVVAISWIAMSLLIVAGAIDGLRNAPRELRIAAVVAAATLAILAVTDTADFVAVLARVDDSALQVPFTLIRYVAGIGLVYALLRRMLNVDVAFVRLAAAGSTCAVLITLVMLLDSALRAALERLAAASMDGASQSVVDGAVLFCAGVAAIPLYRWLAARIDAAVFRRRHRTLAQLDAIARRSAEAADMRTLQADTAGALRDALPVEWVDVVLGVAPEPRPAEVTFALARYGVDYGALACGQRTDGRPFRRDEIAALERVAAAMSDACARLSPRRNLPPVPIIG